MARSRQRLSILVALEDDYERERLVEMLGRAVSSVAAAADAATALERFRAESPDVTLVDMNLSDSHGNDPVTLIRREREDAPVIVVYDSYNPRRLLEVVERNVDAFIRSPVDQDRLLTALRRCARNVFLRRRLRQADRDLHRLLDAFPAMALLEKDGRVIYANRPLANYCGYEDHEAMNADGAGPGEYMERLDGTVYEGGDERWIAAVTDDRLDVDHVAHLVNPANPDGLPGVFSVNHSSLPGSGIRLISFHDVSALEDKRRHLADEASTDPLTRALNRRSFLRILEECAVRDRTLSLIMFDIDHFKSINDTYGHDVGDSVLREISALVRSDIRRSDFFARWGGEEFMVLLPASDMDRAVEAAERLREAVEASDFTGVPRQITSSFGVAMRRPAESSDEFVKRVDQALYDAKEAGRNQVVVG